MTPTQNGSSNAHAIESTSINNVTSHAAGATRGSTILLGTAMVMVTSPNGRKTFARALIDSGSEVTCDMRFLGEISDSQFSDDTDSYYIPYH